MKTLKKILPLIAVIAIVLCAVSCSTVSKEGLWEEATYRRDTELGEGAKTIYVEVVAGEESVTFTIHTDKENLADAMLEHGLVEGENSTYGLYIKKVNGITADYNIDASYWSLTVGGEYSMDGASFTTLTDGAHYEFTYTK